MWNIVTHCKSHVAIMFQLVLECITFLVLYFRVLAFDFIFIHSTTDTVYVTNIVQFFNMLIFDPSIVSKGTMVLIEKL